MTNDIIEKLMEIERRAQEIIGEADNRKAHIEEEIQSEVSKMDADYTAEANARVKKIIAFEEEEANKKLDKIKKDTEASKKKIHDTYIQNKDRWLDELYKKVIG